MAFLERKGTVTIAAAQTAGSTSITLGAPYARVTGFIADVTTGTDNATKVKLTDGNGIVFYLDAADKDYTTEIYKYIQPDDTVTGLGATPVDATGAAVAAAQVARELPVVKSPVTVDWSNGTATEVLTISLIVDTGV